VEQGFGLPVRDMSLYYIRHGERHTWRLNAETFFETRDWIDQTVAAIREERNWDPVEGKQCNVCPFWSNCPKKKRQDAPLQDVPHQMNIYDLEGLR
jgi:hypothetical protein